jgi:hypothetical protein
VPPHIHTEQAGMSETTNNQPQQAEVDTTEILFNLVVAFLAPMFLTATGGNVQQARITAAHTLDSFQAMTRGELITSALIIAFSLTAMSSLSLSMQDGLPLPLILRLRGNAQSASRAAEQNRCALQQDRRLAPQAEGAFDPREAELSAKEVEVIAAVAAARKRVSPAQTQPAQTQPAQTQPAQTQPTTPSPAPTTQDPHVQAWASAFMDVAAEIAAEIPHLPRDERRAAVIRVEALHTSADAIRSGNVEPRPRPGDRIPGDRIPN